MLDSDITIIYYFYIYKNSSSSTLQNAAKKKIESSQYIFLYLPLIDYHDGHVQLSTNTSYTNHNLCLFKRRNQLVCKIKI